MLNTRKLYYYLEKWLTENSFIIESNVFFFLGVFLQ